MRSPAIVTFAIFSLFGAFACRGHRPAEAAPSGEARSDSAVTVARVARDTVPVAPAARDTATVREYWGTYSSGYEISWFEPCNPPAGERMWWVTLSEDARLQRDSLVKLLPSRPTQGLAVHWRASLSPRMRGGAGHMGRGSRYMLVTRILSLRAIGEGVVACGGRDT